MMKGYVLIQIASISQLVSKLVTSSFLKYVHTHRGRKYNGWMLI